MIREPASPLPTPVCGSCGSPLPPDAPRGHCPACLWELAANPGEDDAPAGALTRRFGSYELIEEIARGGMGVVWRARQEGLGREVALKMILSGQLATSAQVSRFYTEARAAARLDHPQIVPIHEIGEDGGCHFYTMRLMVGGSLAEVLRTGPRPSPSEAARIIATVARAIHYAHQRGVLHRDVKPSNILLDADGKPHVADFGLARISEEDSGWSRSGGVLGTPAYMAPEQAAGRSREVTVAADVYSLGVVLYEFLTGAPPFQAETPIETLRLVLDREPASARSRNPRLDRDLEVICAKCLQKRPEKRYAAASELADDLERWLAGRPILARPVSTLERIVSWARRRPELATSLTALLVILLVALAVTLTLLVQVRRESGARAAALRSEEGQRLSFQSLAVEGVNPGQALLLALEAAERSPSLSANNALFEALQACRERRRFLGHEHMVYFASFSPDEGRVVTASQDRTARVWSTETGEAVCLLRGHERALRTAVFSADGKRVLTASDDATARIWDASNGRPLVVFRGHEHPLKLALFSPRESRVLTVSQNTARLWDAASGQALRVLDWHTGEVICGAFSPDGERVVTGDGEGRALVWDAATGSLLATLAGHRERVLDVAFSGDGLRLATASNREARVWDASTYREICAMRGHQYDIYSLALTTDGAKLVTGSEDFTARIWDAATGKQLHVLPHGHKVVKVALSPDDALLLTASYDKVARVFDLGTGKLVAEMRGHAAPLYHAAFSPSGRAVVTSCVDYTARLWEVRPAQPLRLEASGPYAVISADVTADGRTIAEAYQNQTTVRLLDLLSRREAARLAGHGAEVNLVRFSPEGGLVVTASADKTARLWDAGDGKCLAVLTGHEVAILSADFSPDGRRVLTISDRAARLWNTGDGSLAAVYTGEWPFVYGAFSPDSDRLALTDQRLFLRMIRISSGEVRVSPPGEHYFAVDFGPEGREVVVSSTTTRMRIENPADGTVSGTLIHPARATWAGYSPDRRWIATMADDWVVRVWEAARREERLDLKRAGKLARTVHFPADGRSIVITWVNQGIREETGKEVVIYPLDVVGTARAARFGDLTPDERDQFQLGSMEERRLYRRNWRNGHIFGQEPAAER